MERTGASEQSIRQQLLREFNNPIRVGSVEDIGNLVAFAVSSQASWLHGSTIDLDGGEIPVL
jgi:NAD(P)-dependent dehydrogenase (short-subunit alcohol dehydrogenase family)